MSNRSLDAVAQELYGKYYISTEYPFELNLEEPTVGVEYFEVESISEAKKLRLELVAEAINNCEEELAQLKDLLIALEPKK